MNKYYEFDRLKLYKWLADTTNFSKTYIKIERIPGLKSKPIGLGILKYKEDKYITVISGILRADNSIFNLYDTRFMQKINSNEYNDYENKISKCLLKEFKCKESNLIESEYLHGLWWDSFEMYIIPNLIFDTAMQY